MKDINNIKLDSGFTAAPVLIFTLTVFFTSVCFMLNIQYIAFALPIAVLIVLIAGVKFNRSMTVCLFTKKRYTHWQTGGIPGEHRFIILII